ncbi:hypothetical protein Cgig2_026230 [Carnegiea gigantea]|uniref:Uncharacterized protein n=1 Tax=Carnegiea gigantea TaxID=171969 RepID=A0A9Q1QI53_9CARY|nr:hypothetical protein Cgig2_026230 [Carnegiea gigantea]
MNEKLATEQSLKTWIMVTVIVGILEHMDLETLHKDMDSRNNLEGQKASTMLGHSGAISDAKTRWKQMGYEEKKAAVQEEMKLIQQLPFNSRYATRRLHVLNKILQLMSIQNTEVPMHAIPNLRSKSVISKQHRMRAEDESRSGQQMVTGQARLSSSNTSRKKPRRRELNRVREMRGNLRQKQTLQQQLDNNNGSNTRTGIGTSSCKKGRVTSDYGKPRRMVGWWLTREGGSIDGGRAIAVNGLVGGFGVGREQAVGLGDLPQRKRSWSCFLPGCPFKRKVTFWWWSGRLPLQLVGL